MDRSCGGCITSLVAVLVALTGADLSSAQEAKPPEHVAKPVRDAWKKAGFSYGWRGGSVGRLQFFEDTGDNAVGDVPFFHIGEWKPGIIKRLPAPEQPFGLDLWELALGKGMLEELTGLRHLHSLYLYAEESFPGLEHLASLPRLHTIVTVGGKATDQMVKDLGAIKSLRNLQLLDTDPADADLSPLKNVHTLLVPYVSETGLKQLAGLTNVKDFSTYGVGWTETKAALLARFKHLESLWISAKLTDKDIRHVGGLKNLRSLRLTNAQITDAGVKHLLGLKELRLLDVSETGVTDACLEHVAQLPKLEELNVSGTALTPAGIARLMKALPKLKINTKPRHQFAVDEFPK